jgi:hypothetical protein
MTRSTRRNSPRPPAWLAGLMLGGGALLLALTAWLAWPRSGAPANPIEVRGAPKLKVSAEVIDLGPVKFGRWVSAAFTLTNVGDQPLRFAGQPYIEVVEGC